MMTRNDAALRDLYARLQHARRPHARPGDIPVETIHALATGSYQGPDRESLLDDVLGNAATHAEFQFFRDLGRAQSGVRTARFRSWGRPLALAAAAILVVTLGVRNLSPGASDDPFRGGDSAVVLLSAVPEGATWRFTWRAVPDAVAYDLEVMEPSGEVVASATTTDSTLATALGPSARNALSWYLTARLADGQVLRSAVQAMPLAR